MVKAYLDTSAAMKLLVAEPESSALRSWLMTAGSTRDVLGSMLLHAELHCAASRHPARIQAFAVGVVLATVTLVDVTRGDLLTAGRLPGGLRSNDAINLAAALRVGVDEMLTYDRELAAAATAAGLAVIAPA